LECIVSYKIKGKNVLKSSAGSRFQTVLVSAH
jgi:hypothetical protein